MQKNTLIAIVLSTLVVIVTLAIQSRFLPQNYVSEPLEVQETEITENQLSNFVDSDANESVEEKLITVETDKAEIILTTRGGDIISYKLKNHIDTDKNEGVQLVDNVSDFNRACAVGLGNADSLIINKIFSVKQEENESEKILTFTRNISLKEDDGNIKNFIIGKRYTFKDDYIFKLEILFHSENETEFAYSLRTAPQIGPHYNPKHNRYENRQFVYYTGTKSKHPIIAAKKYEEFKKPYKWNGIAGKYFEEIIILNPEEGKTQEMNNTWYSSKVEVNDYANAQAICVRKPVNSTDLNDTYYLYFGPRNEKDLKIYNSAEKNPWNLSGIRLNESLASSGMLGWLETILKWILEVINKFVHNWGISIIIMTILIKLLMFPISIKQSLNTLRMQKLQPKMTALQTKYQNNPQKLQEEMAKLYKAEDYNPMSGCLPLILQFLILFALYNLFNYYFEFRGAMFVPHWIEDLSSKDSIYTFKKDIPWFGNQLSILPFIYLASQLLFGKITNMGGAATTGSTQAQMKMMMYGMPIIFFVLFYHAPSGLLLYWTVSNIFQMVQQLIINNTMKKKKAEITHKNK